MGLHKINRIFQTSPFAVRSVYSRLDGCRAYDCTDCYIQQCVRCVCILPHAQYLVYAQSVHTVVCINLHNPHPYSREYIERTANGNAWNFLIK